MLTTTPPGNALSPLSDRFVNFIRCLNGNIVVAADAAIPAAEVQMWSWTTIVMDRDESQRQITQVVVHKRPNATRLNSRTPLAARLTELANRWPGPC